MNLSNIPYGDVFVGIKKTVHRKTLGLGLVWNIGLEMEKLGFSSGSAEGHCSNYLSSGLHFPSYVKNRWEDRTVAANLGCTLVSSRRLTTDDALWLRPQRIRSGVGPGIGTLKVISLGDYSIKLGAEAFNSSLSYNYSGANK